uniref:Uncharacterized protein n=1 Tax=Timema douglasi TaxID=61478 RepID=A0A7R8VB29_TIMDO|nr:unnamed protein product [Timema douglasi]
MNEVKLHVSFSFLMSSHIMKPWSEDWQQSWVDPFKDISKYSAKCLPEYPTCDYGAGYHCTLLAILPINDLYDATYSISDKELNIRKQNNVRLVIFYAHEVSTFSHLTLLLQNIWAGGGVNPLPPRYDLGVVHLSTEISGGLGVESLAHNPLLTVDGEVEVRISAG